MNRCSKYGTMSYILSRNIYLGMNNVYLHCGLKINTGKQAEITKVYTGKEPEIIGVR